jgi:hypothetical protein
MPTNDERATNPAEPAGQPARRRRWRRQTVTGVAALTGLATVTAAAGLGAALFIVRSGPASSARTVSTRATHPSARTAVTAQPDTGPLPGTQLDQAITPAPSAAAEAGLPRYYAVASQAGTPALQVRSSATGKIVSTVAGPTGCMPDTYQVATAGDDRNFIFSCLVTATRKNRFYRLRISSRGVPAPVTSLPVPLVASAFVTGLALTPDGRRLALGLQRGAGAVIEVVTLATGAHQAWSGPKMGRPTLLTWADHEREIGFWSEGLRVLNLAKPGSNLASARLALSIFHQAELVQEAMLSPDGTTIIADVAYNFPHGKIPAKTSAIGGIAEVAAGSGKTERLFIAQHVHGNAIYPCQLTAIDASGHHILAGCDQSDRIDRGRVTALAGPDVQIGFSATW